MSCIRSLIVKDDYKLEALLENGSFVRWGSKVEISIGELFQLARK